tara:strand:- start:268 stop:2109 length:1842 start_codon:yes stop_codon:yes gene_type:complete
MAIDIQKKIKKEKTRSFLAKDFEALRQDLLLYARTYFSDKIQDFSEASLGGLLLDMAAYVGDTMSYYLDHQFNELDPTTAVETSNLVRHLRNAGVTIVGSSPAATEVEIFIEVPANKVSGKWGPKESCLPTVLAGSVFASNSGITFNLVEDTDFSQKDKFGNFKAKILIGETAGGQPKTFIMSREALCVSGTETEETYTIGDAHKPFREITLSNENVTDVISVTDSDGNIYYEVESLSQDTVFKAVLSQNVDNDIVPMNMEVIPVPRRFVSKHDIRTRLTTLRFGAGDSSTLEDDIIPDPSELSLPLYGKKTFSRFSIDPNSLLKTHTLGIAPLSTTLTVQYRSGGGLSHNVPAQSIRFVQKLLIEFRKNPSNADANYVRGSIDVKNRDEARGGDNAPTLEALRAQIPAARQMQSRIVSKQDLLARIYTMPSQFGRVYRAGIRPNPFNPLSTQLFVISRDISGNLAISPDILKENLVTYLNEFRLISDSIDILDARVINFSIKFSVLTMPTANKQKVVQKVIQRLTKVMNIKFFQIDQPIVRDDITNVIINTQGVISLIDLQVVPIVGTILDRKYSNDSFDFSRATKRGMIVGPPGSIFELKFPTHDIIGSAA